ALLIPVCPRLTGALRRSRATAQSTQRTVSDLPVSKPSGTENGFGVAGASFHNLRGSISRGKSGPVYSVEVLSTGSAEVAFTLTEDYSIRKSAYYASLHRSWS